MECRWILPACRWGARRRDVRPDHTPLSSTPGVWVRVCVCVCDGGGSNCIWSCMCGGLVCEMTRRWAECVQGVTHVSLGSWCKASLRFSSVSNASTAVSWSWRCGNENDHRVVKNTAGNYFIRVRVPCIVKGQLFRVQTFDPWALEGERFVLSNHFTNQTKPRLAIKLKLKLLQTHVEKTQRRTSHIIQLRTVEAITKTLD